MFYWSSSDDSVIVVFDTEASRRTSPMHSHHVPALTCTCSQGLVGERLRPHKKLCALTMHCLSTLLVFQQIVCFALICLLYSVRT